MSKIAFIADIHLGFGNRLADSVWALRVVREYCNENNIDKVIILGDLFHDRESLSIEVLCAAYEFFKETRDKFNQDWVAFPGNHDMFLKHSWDINSLKPLSEILTIINDVKIIQINGGRFWILPFVYSERAYMNILKQIEEQYEEGEVLPTHIGVCSATLNICFLLQNWSIVNFAESKFDKIFTGHFHIYHKIGQTTYIGSLIPFKFDEGDSEHGFIVYETSDRSNEFVDIWEAGHRLFPGKPQPPQYCSLHDTLLGDKTEQDVKGCNIRIMATKQYTTNEQHQIRERLKNLGANSISFTNFFEENEHVEIEEKPEALSVHELFPKWFDADTRGVKDLRRNLAMRLNTEIVQEGDEIYLEEN